MRADELSARLLSTFVGELEEQVQVWNARLLALESKPDDPEQLRTLFRVAHTLKGAARAANVPLIEQTCHHLETFLAQVQAGSVSLDRSRFNALFAAADALGEAAARLRSGRALVDASFAPVVAALEQAPGTPAPPAVAEAVASPTAPEPRRDDESVRVPTERLDALVTAGGDLLVGSRRVAGRAGELQALLEAVTASAAEWRQAGRRLRVAVESASAAPQPAVQTLTKLNESLRGVARDVGRLARAATEDARAISRATGDVLHHVRRLRMRPFAEAGEALPRMVRDLAAATAKEIDVSFTGTDVEVDRAVLDGLRDALVQLVRNAVDHGIELPSQRAQAGKPRRGRISVDAALVGDRVLVTVGDDGAGLDLAAIRAKLEHRGMAAPAGEDDVVRALFETGISTREEATAISGRGVGLDVVRAAVAKIQGTVRVAWEPGRGTTFTLECPPTLATVRAVLVSVGPQVLGIPTTHVERLLRVNPPEIKRVEGRSVLPTAQAPVPVAVLARLLPPLVERPLRGPLLLILLRLGDRRLAVTVDEALAELELVVRPVYQGERPLPFVSGAALLPDGGIALLLDPVALFAAALGTEVGAAAALGEPADTAPPRRRILVVDDSLTTRALEQSILEAAGYEVRTAVDGSDAWRTLQEYGGDLVVADVEMPRMDGFALCEAIRASKQFKDLPVVLVTAMETPDHRARGLEIGADAYIGKSGFDQQSLLDAIRQLLG